MNNSAFLQRTRGNQSSTSKLVKFFSSLPPVIILELRIKIECLSSLNNCRFEILIDHTNLRNNMKNLSFLKFKSSFFTRNIRIIVRIIIEQSFNTDFALSVIQFSVSWDQFKRYYAFGILL